MQTDAVVAILAGGSGTRFWPMSRRRRPKQLLTLFGEEPLISDTIERVAATVPRDRILVVSGAEHADAIAQATGLPSSQLLVEPCPRNTAAAVGLAAVVAFQRFGDVPLAVLPSDHFIPDVEAFGRDLSRALAHAAVNEEVVVFGIPPTRPETGFGYIRRGPLHQGATSDAPVYTVGAFVEKPDRATAESYLVDGGYLWNAGMFIATTATFSEAFAIHQPELGEGLERLATYVDAPCFDERLAEQFPSLPAISFDYGVMERLERVSVIPATFPWSDVGTWSALDEFASGPERCFTRGEVLLEDTRDSVVISTVDDKLVAVLGVEGLVVVDTLDALLVCPRSRSQDVRTLVDSLDEGNGSHHL